MSIKIGKEREAAEANRYVDKVIGFIEAHREELFGDEEVTVEADYRGTIKGSDRKSVAKALLAGQFADEGSYAAYLEDVEKLREWSRERPGRMIKHNISVYNEFDGHYWQDSDFWDRPKRGAYPKEVRSTLNLSVASLLDKAPLMEYFFEATERMAEKHGLSYEKRERQN